MNKKILIAIPSIDFDPTEVSVPWKQLSKKGYSVSFATPDGQPATGDMLIVTGKGFGLLKKSLMARKDAVCAYEEMIISKEFQNPQKYQGVNPSKFDALILPGGHAKGMRVYLESEDLRKTILYFFEKNKPVGSICHGAIAVARTKNKQGQSVLWNREVTGLTKKMELTAYRLTRLWLQDYYLTYPTTVEDEIKQNLKNSSQFKGGPSSFKRDTEIKPNGFVVKDGNYVSARWPGDVYAFTFEFEKLLQ